MKTLDLKINLRNENQMPQFGLGTYKMTDEAITKAATVEALKLGYRMIDTADYYGNHKIIAQAIKESGVKREEIFITTKIWPADYENVEMAYARCLAELDVKYIDLVLLHWPVQDFELTVKGWKGLEKLYKEGKVKNIGVSNFMPEHLEKLKGDAEIMPFVDQIEMHPGLPMLEVTGYCQAHNIVMTSWQTIMRGKTDDIPLLVELAEKYKVDTASIALKWAMMRDYIVIPKSNTPSRIASNAANQDLFTLTEKEIDAISNIEGERLGPDPYTFNRIER